MVYKRVTGLTSGRSLPLLNFVKYLPGLLETAVLLRSSSASTVSVNGISSLRIEQLFLLFGLSATRLGEQVTFNFVAQ